jgi:hypothetical protein
MVQIESIIGKFITLSYREPELLDNHPLRIRLENFIDLLVGKIDTKGIESLNLLIQDELFRLRLEVIDFLRMNEDIRHIFECKILEEINNKYFIKGVHQKLAAIYSDTLEIYFRIFENFSSEVDLNASAKQLDSENLPTFSGLKNLYKLQPTPEFACWLRWAESSLNYEYYLIIAELVFHELVKIDTKEAFQLQKEIRVSLEDFAAYSSISGLWRPLKGEESPLLRNIKIKIAHYRSQVLQANHIDPKSLKDIILS